MPLDHHLHIIAGYKNGRTFPGHCFYKQPFKLANVTEDKSSEWLRLMITSSSPGILDNDKYAIKIELEEYAKVYLTTQGYQRIFSMANKASQRMNVELKNNTSLCFLPHPNVPHQQSSFSSVNNIYLNTCHHLVWSDIITCGRKLSGEEFKFSRYQNVTNIFLNSKLVMRENVFLQPFKNDVHALGQLEGFTHQSTLLFLSDKTNAERISAECYAMLSGVENITFGISALPVNGLIFRILSYKGEQLFDLNNKIANVIEKMISPAITPFVCSTS